MQHFKLTMKLHPEIAFYIVTENSLAVYSRPVSVDEEKERHT